VTTSGNHLVEGGIARGLLRLSGPMFVGALLQNLQSVIDLFWVGRLGSESVAALAVAGTILMLLFPVIMGVSMGTVAMVSRAIGAGNPDEAGEIAGQSMLLALIFGLIAGAVGYFCARTLCQTLGAAPEVAPLATTYLRISFIGAFTVFMLFVGNSSLQGAGNSTIPMCAMALATLLNLVLDPLLIFGLLGLPRMGVAGAAIATVLAQAVAVVVVMAVLHSGRVAGMHAHLGRWRLRSDLAWRLLRIGTPSSGQMLSRSLMSLVLMRIVAETGTNAVAAYGIGLRFHMIVLMPAFTLANAVATMVGQNLGAGKPQRAHRAAWIATGMDVAIMVVAAIILVFAAKPLIAAFDDNPEVVKIGANYLRVVSPFYVFAALAIVLGRALMGAGDTMGSMVCTVIGLWGVQVPLAIYLSRVITPPTQGVWWAIAAAVTVHGLLITAWFETGRWKHQKV
jgi:putative MATE family efflux protein